MSPYSDKVAIVTGGSSGIGLALARSLARHGASVTIVSRSPSRVRQATESLQAEGLAVEGSPADVTDREAVEAVVQAVLTRHGRIDLMFNNAGISAFGEVRDHLQVDWDNIIAVNLRGVVNGVTSVYKHMIRQGFGHIVNISSLAGLVPGPGAIAYTTTKAAVVSLSQSLRMEAARYGVKVSVACPASVWTSIIDTSPFRCLDRERFIAAVPGTPDTPDNCARAILRGVARNKAVIAPGLARLLWLFHRYVPFVARFIMGQMGRLVAENRDHQERVMGGGEPRVSLDAHGSEQP